MGKEQIRCRNNTC